MPDTRTKWAAALHLQQAADHLRDVTAPDPMPAYADPVADWLDKSANDMAWLAPYREHEGGYRPWRLATRFAHCVLDLPDPDNCPTCHTHARKQEETT